MKAQHIIFTTRAFNAIITETLDKDPLETGGIFIGYILNNGIWVVVETIPPGIETINQRSYFEYDANFINYLSNVIAKQYKGNLQVLGLWHRHPGSMDVFSTTDDDTNMMFARANPMGAISGLINYDPRMRLTMYHVDSQCRYTQTDWSVDDEIIPKNLLELRFINPSEFPILNNNAVPNFNPASINPTSQAEPTVLNETENRTQAEVSTIDNNLPNREKNSKSLGEKFRECLNILKNE